MNPSPAPITKKILWAGYIMSALPVLLLIFSATLKLLKPASMVQGWVHSGFPESQLLTLGMVELTCTAVYLIPRTAVLGAILLTGYLGGATAATVRVGDPFLFPIITGVLVWGGLFLRDQRVRELMPLRR